MNFPEEIMTVLKKAKKPLKAAQILALLKKANPQITIDKKELNQIIWKDLRQKINYNNSDFTISIKDANDDFGTIPNIIIGDYYRVITETRIIDPYEQTSDSQIEIKIGDILKIVVEEKIRLGTHEANLMAENITIRLKNKYGAN